MMQVDPSQSEKDHRNKNPDINDGISFAESNLQVEGTDPAQSEISVVKRELESLKSHTTLCLVASFAALILSLAQCSSTSVSDENKALPSKHKAGAITGKAESNAANDGFIMPSAQSTRREYVKLNFNGLSPTPAADSKCDGESWMLYSGNNDEQILTWHPEDTGKGPYFSIMFKALYNGSSLYLSNGVKQYDDNNYPSEPVSDKTISLTHEQGLTWRMNGKPMIECSG